MAKEPEERQSGISDADLCADADKRLVALRRDQAALQPDGVTTQRLDDFEADVKQLRNLPADTFDEQIKALENERRDDAMETVRDAIRQVRGPVADAYGDRSRQYKALGTAELADLNEADLYSAAATCAAAANVLLTDEKIVQEGLTAGRIADIEPAVTALRTVVKQRDTLVMQRSLNAQDRVRRHNAINDECSTLCGKGYRKFWKTDPKRADDYVRDPAPGAAPAADGTSPTS